MLHFLKPCMNTTHQYQLIFEYFYWTLTDFSELIHIIQRLESTEGPFKSSVTQPGCSVHKNLLICIGSYTLICIVYQSNPI